MNPDSTTTTYPDWFVIAANAIGLARSQWPHPLAVNWTKAKEELTDWKQEAGAEGFLKTLRFYRVITTPVKLEYYFANGSRAGFAEFTTPDALLPDIIQEVIHKRDSGKLTGLPLNSFIIRLEALGKAHLILPT